MRPSSIEIVRISRLDLSAMPAWICLKCPPAFPSRPSYGIRNEYDLFCTQSVANLEIYREKNWFDFWTIWFLEVLGNPLHQSNWGHFPSFANFRQLQLCDMRVIESWRCSGHHLDEGLRVGISTCQLVVNHKSLCNDIDDILVLFQFR